MAARKLPTDKALEECNRKYPNWTSLPPCEKVLLLWRLYIKHKARADHVSRAQAIADFKATGVQFMRKAIKTGNWSIVNKMSGHVPRDVIDSMLDRLTPCDRCVVAPHVRSPT